MNLYLLSQDTNRGYDTYDAMVVAAPNNVAASKILPSESYEWGERHSPWCERPDQVEVELIGVAQAGTETGVILASFNAG